MRTSPSIGEFRYVNCVVETVKSTPSVNGSLSNQAFTDSGLVDGKSNTVVTLSIVYTFIDGGDKRKAFLYTSVVNSGGVVDEAGLVITNGYAALVATDVCACVRIVL